MSKFKSILLFGAVSTIWTGMVENTYGSMNDEKKSKYLRHRISDLEKQGDPENKIPALQEQLENLTSQIKTVQEKGRALAAQRHIEEGNTNLQKEIQKTEKQKKKQQINRIIEDFNNSIKLLKNGDSQSTADLEYCVAVIEELNTWNSTLNGINSNRVLNNTRFKFFKSIIYTMIEVIKDKTNSISSLTTNFEKIKSDINACITDLSEYPLLTEDEDENSFVELNLNLIKRKTQEQKDLYKSFESLHEQIIARRDIAEDVKNKIKTDLKKAGMYTAYLYRGTKDKYGLKKRIEEINTYAGTMEALSSNETVLLEERNHLLEECDTKIGELLLVLKDTTQRPNTDLDQIFLKTFVGFAKEIFTVIQLLEDIRCGIIPLVKSICKVLLAKRLEEENASELLNIWSTMESIIDSSDREQLIGNNEGTAWVINETRIPHDSLIILADNLMALSLNLNNDLPSNITGIFKKIQKDVCDALEKIENSEAYIQAHTYLSTETTNTDGPND